MSTFTHLVSQFVSDFKNKIPDEDTATALTIALGNFEGELQQHFTGKGPKKQRKQRDRDPDAPKKTNWQATWTSNAYGCRQYEPFAAQLQALTEANEKMGRFEVNKHLKAWAEANGLYAQWQEDTKQRLIAEGKPVPGEKAEAVAETVSEAVADVPVAAPAAVPAEVPAAVPATAPVTKGAPRKGGRGRGAAAAPAAQ